MSNELEKTLLQLNALALVDTTAGEKGAIGSSSSAAAAAIPPPRPTRAPRPGAVNVLETGVAGTVTLSCSATEDDTHHGTTTLPLVASSSSESHYHHNTLPPLTTLPAGLPPSLGPQSSSIIIGASGGGGSGGTATTTADGIGKAAANAFLLDPTQALPSLRDPRPGLRYWPRAAEPLDLLTLEVTEARTSVAVKTDQVTGAITGFEEALLDGVDQGATNSLNLVRRAGRGADRTRGENNQYPFRPGGMDDEAAAAAAAPQTQTEGVFDTTTTPSLLGLEGPLETTPPGFECGMIFPEDERVRAAGIFADASTVSVAPSQSQEASPGVAVVVESGAATAAPNNNTVLSLSSMLDLEFVEEAAEEAEAGEEAATAAVLAAAAAPEPGASDAALLETALEAGRRGATVGGDGANMTSGEGGEKSENGGGGAREWAVRVDPKVRVRDFAWQVPRPAYTWPFELDDFQKQAVLRLEQHESVFVAAHTSAGKTVVAEYAIALCAKHMTRCIYTSPIKALSNQKFRDFRERFGDVGLLTGDVQIRPEASCLIMTTEILRSMLYRGADIIRDVEWVIFDEVHYINDSERGVVWEEVIIMLPKHVNLILLSATVPNTFEFADWVGRTKRKPIHVISTSKRPVPLEHFLYTGSDGKTSGELFLLVNSRKELQMDGHRRAVAAKKSRENKQDQKYGPKSRQRGGGAGADKTLYVSLVKMLKAKELHPCVIFTFSKRRCESNATALTSLDLTSAQEKSEVHVLFQQSVARLKKEDRVLPQVKRMAGMLRRGIGVHHSGLLPIMKEVVEMLFARGLVRVLFATETFAMGVNMPAKCVVFDSTRKHDGTGFRDLLPGEYVQMAGRAGRRGLDTTGTVIILCKGDVQEVGALNTMILGKPTRLESQFRLTYNMILNLLRVEELKVEDMMRRSFAESGSQRETAELQASLEASKKHLEAVEARGGEPASGSKAATSTPNAAAAKVAQEEELPDLDEFYQVCAEIVQMQLAVQQGILGSPQCAKVLSCGRVIVVNNAIYRNAPAILLKEERARARSGAGAAADRQFSVLVLRDDPQMAAQRPAPPPGQASAPMPPTHIFRPAAGGGGGGGGGTDLHFDVTKVGGMEIMSISVHKLDVSLFNVLQRPKRAAQALAAQDLAALVVAHTAGEGTTLDAINPVTELRLRDLDFVDAYTRLRSLQTHAASFACAQHADLERQYARAHTRHLLNEQITRLQYRLSDQSLYLLPEYHQRVEVLKCLRYIDDENTVQLKGRAACEVTTCDELVVTELVFDNVFTPMEPAEIVALLSSLVFQERVDTEPNLTPTLEAGVETLQRAAAYVARTQAECGMDSPVDDYVRNGLKFGLVEVVYEWARGLPFAEITNLTDVLEGSIVRCITRLDETCRDVRNAARVIGDPVLYEKMDTASQLIKRDIVFAASLYVNS